MFINFLACMVTAVDTAQKSSNTMNRKTMILTVKRFMWN